MSMHHLEDDLNAEFAPAWRPEPGDTLVGEVVALGERVGYNDQPYPIVTVRKDDGEELALHGFHTVVQNELKRARPQVGETIGVKYIGERAGAGGRSKYHAYRVAVDRPAAAFSWAKYGDHDDPVGQDIPTDDDATMADFAATPPAAAPATDDDIPF